MAKEYWYFLGGVLAVLLPLAAFVAVKKLNLLEPRADDTFTYSEVDGRPLKLHAFRARGDSAGEPAPALLLFHGGRWLYGGPEQLFPQCRYFARRGYHCFSAAYRLGANNRPDVPGALGDARAALRYLREHAAQLGIDPARVYAGGSSSGGHLAAALGAGLPGPDPAAPRPAGLVLYNPMLDLSPGTPDHHLVKTHWEAVSPLQHVDAAFPPALILVGSEDPEVPVATVEGFCTRVRESGGRCETEIYPGRSHGFFHYADGANPLFDATGERITGFLTALRD